MNLPVPYPQVHLRVLAPSSLDSLAPLEVTDDSSGVHAAIVERYAIENLPVHWRTSCGFYILFSALAEDNRFDAYVGKASSGFHRRLASHNETKDYWRSAILISKDSSTGFTSTQSAFLEGRMRDVLDLSPNVNVRNIANTGDSTLPEWEVPDMERVILSTLRIMFLRGFRNASMGAFADSLTSKIAGHGVTFNPSVSAPYTPAHAPVPVSSPEDEKYLALKEWRKEESKRASISPFIVFHDKTLREIARASPKTVEELLAIPGVGQHKASLYGLRLVALFAS